MLKSKFITLFRTLDKKEVSAFGSFVKNHHGSSGVAPEVYRYVKKFYPTFADGKKLEISYAYQKIFNKPIRDDRKKLLNTLYDLHHLLKRFLLLEKVSDNSQENNLLWCEILKERELDTELGKYVKKLYAKVKDKPRKGIEDYMQGMAINYYYYYQLLHEKLSENINSLKDCGHDLDLFYAICRVKVACEMANRKNVMSLEYSFEALPAVDELSSSYTVHSHPLLHLYLKVYCLIANQDDHLYPEIEHILSNNMDTIEPEELHTVLSYLHNYAAYKVRRGHEDYWELVHKLDKFGVKHHVFLRSGEISAPQFSNIVQAASKVGDFGWTEHFITTHIKLVYQDHRQGALKLSKAIILFNKNEFRRSLDLLDSSQFTDLYHGIRAKALTLICYFELDDPELDVVGYCIAFEGFLKRNRKPKREVVEATLQFVKVVKMLSKQKAHKELVLEIIDSGAPVYFKGWLLQKAKGYEQL